MSHFQQVRFLMRTFVAIATLITVLTVSPSVQAVEPSLEFLEGLRQRRYFDTALTYLDQLTQSDQTPKEVRELIPYERAQTLLQSAQDLTNLDAQRKQLDAAQAAFEEFVKAVPNHELAGRANSARGNILLEKARVEIWDGEKPSNEGNKQTYFDKARGFIQQARRIFTQASDQHKKAWEKFPTYIPEDNKSERAARDAAEVQYMEAQLDLAQTKYWEAQTFDKKAKERKEILIQAAEEFEQIHTKYRSMVGGLFARMWQGKCWEEQDEIGIALGIYEELLGHEGRSNALRRLKDTALRFRLICLNHEKRKDYTLVVAEGEEWLNDSRARARTPVGLGIQWEVCRAHEELGLDRTLSDLLKKNHLNQALNGARAVNRYPGELKTPSSAMIQRIMVALNRDPGDPKDFDTAYGNAGQLWDEMQQQTDELKKLVAARKMQEAKGQQSAVQATAAEMTRLYDLALKLATMENDPRMVALARMRLAYGYLQQKRFLDAAVVAEHQMLKFGEEYPEIGREAGFIAMASFDTAYTEADPNDRVFEAEMVRRSAEQIATRWPNSDRANDARNAVAKIYFNDNNLLKAAEWWEKIPEGTSQYNSSQIRAGNAYWRQYAIEASKPEGERAEASELLKWKTAAIQRLEAGINGGEKETPKDSPLSDEVVRAKLSLVSIRNLDGIYKTADGGPTGALELLTQGDHPIIKAVEVGENEQRPTEPTAAKSREMASFAYQQLLRTYIGLKNLDEARKARKKLEEVAGGEDDAALTQVFVDFGKELEQELERLQAAGETDRLAEVREGFEAFLNDLFNREDGQTFYSLLWIAETYASLGDGSNDNPTKQEEFFNKAASTYQTILDKAAGDASFVSNPTQILACKLRMVDSLRRQGDFAKAEQTILDVINQSPNAPDAQFAAANLYQEWGESGAVDAPEKFKLALYGKGKAGEPGHVWGWGYAAQSLQRAVYQKKEPKLVELHFNARYNLAETHREYAKVLPDADKATEQLELGQSAIRNFHAISQRWPDEEYARFNGLYREILSDLGTVVTDLPREPGQTPPPIEGGGGGEEDVAQVGKPIVDGPGPEEPKSNKLLMLLMIVLGAAAVAGLYFMAVGQGKKKYAQYEGKTASIMHGGGQPEKISFPTGGVATKPKQQVKKKVSVDQLTDEQKIALAKKRKAAAAKKRAQQKPPENPKS